MSRTSSSILPWTARLISWSGYSNGATSLPLLLVFLYFYPGSFLRSFLCWTCYSLRVTSCALLLVFLPSLPHPIPLSLISRSRPRSHCLPSLCCHKRLTVVCWGWERGRHFGVLPPQGRGSVHHGGVPAHLLCGQPARVWRHHHVRPRPAKGTMPPSLPTCTSSSHVPNTLASIFVVHLPLASISVVHRTAGSWVGQGIPWVGRGSSRAMC